MKILVCPDSFKNCLSAAEVSQFIYKGILCAYPSAEINQLPLADGGEGTTEVLVRATGGEMISLEVHDPLMRKVNSFYGILGDRTTAVIEMSAASGLELLKPDERNPMEATTFGTGELIGDALNKGCSKLIIGLG